METPIQVLVREIKNEAENACEIYSHLQTFTSNHETKFGKRKKYCNDNYVLSIRRISELVRAIEKLNQI